jgi:competence protein ComEC
MVLYVAGEYSNKNGIYSLAYNTLIICYLAFIIAFGAAWHSLFDYREIPSEAKVLNTYTWQELHFSGSVQQIIETGTGKYQLDVNIEKTVFPNNLTWTKSYKLRAVVNPDNLAFPEDMQLGSDISFLATVYPLEPKRNPAQFNYKQYLASKGIYSQVGILKIQRLKSPKSNILSWTYWRQIVLDAIKNNFHNRNASLAKALLVGYKNELDRKDKISFSRAGLSHIMAVSGLHVGFILVPFWIVMPFFWTFRFGKQIGLFILTGILFFYAGLTGFSASVTRASLGGGLLIYGRLFHKVRDPKNLAAVAALILLLLNPNELFDIGFQLSFGAVYIILLTIPVISRQLPNWIQYRWYGKPVMVVIISLIVQLGLFPLLAFYFEEFSLVGPLVNAFVIPLLGFVVPYALILIPVGIFLPGIAHTMNIPADIFMSWLNNLVHIITRWDWSWIQVHTSGILLLAIWTIAIFFIATLPIAKIRWKMLIIFLLLLGISQLESIVKKLEPATLDLLVFDVGQGDGMLITTPNRKHFLIDTGRWQPDYNSAKYVIIPYLKAKGIKKLDAVFLSHPHADHIGGLPELIKSIPIDTIYNSGASYNSQLFRRYHKLAAQHHIPIKSISAGIEVPLDSTMRIFTYGPETKAGNHNVNNYSLILELVYGKTEMLFMGDAEKSEEKKLIADYPKLANTDFLKVGHHGSKTSSTTTLLDDITPSQGVVSVAIKNRYHHPNAEAIRRLRRDSVKLHFTSMSGAIRVHSDGKDIWMDK